MGWILVKPMIIEAEKLERRWGNLLKKPCPPDPETARRCGVPNRDPGQ
jgi:hypothetical protein